MGFFLLLINVMILSYVFIDLNCFLRWGMWPMGLLFTKLWIYLGKMDFNLFLNCYKVAFYLQSNIYQIFYYKQFPSPRRFTMIAEQRSLRSQTELNRWKSRLHRNLTLENMLVSQQLKLGRSKLSPIYTCQVPISLYIVYHITDGLSIFFHSFFFFVVA